MENLGETTRDLISLGVTHPSERGLPDNEREKQLRRRSTIWLATAAGTLVTATVATLSVGVYGAEHGLPSNAVRTFIILGVIVASAISSAFLTAFLVDLQLRPMRTGVRRAMARADTNAGIGTTNAELLSELLAAQVAANERMTAIEKHLAKLPDYGQVFNDVYTLVRGQAGLSDLDELPGTGPNEIDRYRRRL